MEENKILKFLIKGSAKEPYKVTFWREKDNFRSACTCPAGKKGMYCKHRFQLLEGDTSNLVSENIKDLSFLPEMFSGSDVAEIYDEFNLLKKQETVFKKINSLVIHRTSSEEKILNELPTKEMLEQGYFILKFGKNCYFYNNNYQCIGVTSMNITQLKKVYPNLLNTLRISALYTYSQEIISCIEQYNPINVKTINEAMKKAMR
ncbi:hypothetical protein [uncultured Fusobacterium sp.]|uniref:hypothetical protein n=1 Tax=uncultured Fusobacterium sp. TaxID=159267 RepID=UPI0025D88881|nr:hypothetical protein [uncultured Fusobacterium sp.]